MSSPDGQLATLPEQVLGLAGAYVRHNDLLTHHALSAPTSADQLTAPRNSSRTLAAHTLGQLARLGIQRRRHPVEIPESFARLRQLHWLTSAAFDTLDRLHGELSIATGALRPPPFGRTPPDPVPLDEVLKDAATGIAIARDLTAHAPADLTACARALAAVVHHHVPAAPPPPDIQRAAAEADVLHAVACGLVALPESPGTGHANSPVRVPLQEVRALEEQGLVQSVRIPGPRPGLAAPSRVHLTGRGCAHLAAAFARSRTTSLTGTPAAVPRPAADAVRSR
ncbi:hypothetical protein ACFYVL_09460 [Streptomyces sp. NPDC004111]|uniref:hypothetical protein n=1 Tax=Streptomyces sp. NPDC004111 TaxID=3364690 RepID=UPI0036950627